MDILDRAKFTNIVTFKFIHLQRKNFVECSVWIRIYNFFSHTFDNLILFRWYFTDEKDGNLTERKKGKEMRHRRLTVNLFIQSVVDDARSRYLTDEGGEGGGGDREFEA